MSDLTSSPARSHEPFDFRIRVSLKWSDPEIWRRIEVPGEFTLAQLHDVLQEVMPWTNSHMHRFEIRGQSYTDLTHDAGLEDDLDEAKWTLSQLFEKPPARFQYEYDFGDSWLHDLVVERIAPAEPDAPRLPKCLDGENAAPPDDCGGMPNYLSILETIKKPKKTSEEKELLEWMPRRFDPAAFSADAANRRLKKRFAIAKSAPRTKKAAALPRRIWAGTALDASALIDDPSVARPLFAIWFDITDKTARVAAVYPGDADDPEHPLIEALFAPLPGIPEDARRPSELRGATPADIEILKANPFESVTVSSRPMPEVLEWAAMALEDFKKMMGSVQPPPLEALVPVAGAPGVDEALVRYWLEGAAACFKAKPWKAVSDAYNFELAFSDGTGCCITLIGQAGIATGLLLFESLEAARVMEEISLTLMENKMPRDMELPRILSLNFDDADELSVDLLEYLQPWRSVWKSKDKVPNVLIRNKGGVEDPTAADFLQTARAAHTMGALVVALKAKKQWPPRPGLDESVIIPAIGGEEKARVRLRAD